MAAAIEAQSTYTDALPTYVNPMTSRVHTSYALARPPRGGSPRSSQSAEHPRSHRRGAPYSPRLHRAGGPLSGFGGLFQIELRLLAISPMCRR